MAIIRYNGVRSPKSYYIVSIYTKARNAIISDLHLVILRCSIKTAMKP